MADETIMLERRVFDVERSIEGVKDKIEGVKDKIEGVKDKMAVYRAVVVVLSGLGLGGAFFIWYALNKLDHVDNRVAATEASAERIGRTVDQLAGRISPIQAQMDKIQAQMDKVQSQMDRVSEDMKKAAEGFAEQINTLASAAVAKQINRMVDDDYLVKSYKADSVLGQIQAQAMCIALSATAATDNSQKWVKAVFRRATVKGGKTGPTCSDVCRATTENYRRMPMTSVFGIAIYGDPDNAPFSPPPEEGALWQTRSSGLQAVRYSKVSSSVPTFGPNYCCCEVE